MDDTKHNYSTPSAVRSVTSYPARRGFKQAVDPALDHVVGVEHAIDIHCHAHEGQQDALGVAKDEMAAKPLVLYEGEDLVALASEEIAIRAIVDREIDTYDPYEREVLVWQR